MSLIGLLTQVVVPSYHSYQAIKVTNDENKAQNNVIVTATNPINRRRYRLQLLQQFASTTQPENLRTEAVVITGEQLGNGVAPPHNPPRQRMSIPL